MTTKGAKRLKKQKLRNVEYYDFQVELDELYSKSQKGCTFNNLLTLITSEQNILLAYRNIKKNKGSKTRGINKSTIIDLGKTDPQRLVAYVKNRLDDFKPHAVRRVEIEKENGKKRPLGIPTIEDRLIQQCIKQVLEPICEAKFHKHSYGFRPNRGTHNAIARAKFLMNISRLHYTVDIDIKGFFDNVNHGKLLKQLWTMGIRDKRLLPIISKMLKAEIKGVGVLNKGVPQGGILSPLLSNIVLNELDWWISSQWETLKTRKEFDTTGHKFFMLKKSKLKEVYIIRYADDFKLMCRTQETAKIMFHATAQWLKERLGLEISEEKSKIINLKKQFSEFLGIKIKVHRKSSKWVTSSRVNDKCVKKCKDKLRQKIKELQANPNIENALIFNAVILGMHNYYKVATDVSRDFADISFSLKKCLYNRTRKFSSGKGSKSKCFIKYYGRYGGKMIYIAKTALFPISHIKTSYPSGFNQNKCNYTPEGREQVYVASFTFRRGKFGDGNKLNSAKIKGIYRGYDTAYMVFYVKGTGDRLYLSNEIKSFNQVIARSGVNKSAILFIGDTLESIEKSVFTVQDNQHKKKGQPKTSRFSDVYANSTYPVHFIKAGDEGAQVLKLMSIPGYREVITREVMGSSYEPPYSDMPDTDTIHYEKPNYPAVMAIDMDIKRIDRACETARRKGFDRIAVYVLPGQLEFVLQRYKNTGKAIVMKIEIDQLKSQLRDKLDLYLPPTGPYFMPDGRCVDVSFAEDSQKTQKT